MTDKRYDIILKTYIYKHVLWLLINYLNSYEYR